MKRALGTLRREEIVDARAGAARGIVIVIGVWERVRDTGGVAVGFGEVAAFGVGVEGEGFEEVGCGLGFRGVGPGGEGGVERGGEGGGDG